MASITPSTTTGRVKRNRVSWTFGVLRETAVFYRAKKIYEFRCNTLPSSLIRVYFLWCSQKQTASNGLSGALTLPPARTQQRCRQWTEFWYNFVFETFTDLCGESPDIDIDIFVN